MLAAAADDPPRATISSGRRCVAAYDLAVASDRIVSRVPARVGLAGNPSDLAGGAVLAVPIPELAATLEIERCELAIEIVGPTGTAAWEDLGALIAQVRHVGHPADHALVTAALLRTLAHLGGRSPQADHEPVGVAAGQRSGWRVTWSTEIPRSVGLAGSSAIVVGVIDAVARSMGRPLDRLVIAALALAVETDDLDIVAGWQDRVVQAMGTAVLVDAGRFIDRDGLAVPVVEPVRVPASVEFLVAWRPDAAEDSGAHHARSTEVDDATGQQARAEAMAALADVARSAARALARGDVAGLENAVRQTWSIRSAAVPLRPDHAALVDALAASGSPATTPGSGGSAVALLTQAAAVESAIAAAERAGARWSTTRGA